MFRKHCSRISDHKVTIFPLNRPNLSFKIYNLTFKIYKNRQKSFKIYKKSFSIFNSCFAQYVGYSNLFIFAKTNKNLK